jgi:hypothetical protein
MNGISPPTCKPGGAPGELKDRGRGKTTWLCLSSTAIVLPVSLFADDSNVKTAQKYFQPQSLWIAQDPGINQGLAGTGLLLPGTVGCLG